MGDGTRDSGSARGELGRRGFLGISGTAALLGLGACYTAPRDRVLAYNARPPGIVPGEPLHYATAYEDHGYGIGLVVTAREGRPIKVDGNPLHPASLGGSGPVEQALLMRLYDPSRLGAVTRGATPATFREYLVEHADLAESMRRTRGAGLRLLVPPTASPLLLELRGRVRERYPLARIVTWDPLPRDAILDGTRLAFGEPLEAMPDLSAARALLLLDADLLDEGPWRLRTARAAADRRVPGGEGLLRIWSVETSLTLSGMFADHRHRVRPSEVEDVARALLARLAARPDLPALAWARGLPAPPPLDPEADRFVAAVTRDLARKRDRALVAAGQRAPPVVHAVAHALNAALGSEARVRFVRPVLDDVAGGPAGLAALADELRGGEVDALLVTAFDPVYTAPGDVGLADAMAKVRDVVVLATHRDATTARARWVLPQTTELERWGDVRALDGTASVVQPIIEPLFEGWDEARVIGPFAGAPDYDARSAVKAAWLARRPSPRFDQDWEDWLARGVIPDTAAPEVRPRLDAARIAEALAAPRRPAPAGLELSFVPSYALRDGRHAHNPWLEELPDPVTKQCWGNAALLGPDTARRAKVVTGQGVRIEAGGRALELPAYVQPGHAEGAVTVALGWGRAGVEDRLEARAGGDAYPLRGGPDPWRRAGARLVTLPGAFPLTRTQRHDSEDGRPIAVARDLEDWRREGAAFLGDLRGTVEKLYDPYPNGGEEDHPYQWALSVDLARCTGCSACVVACQAENDVPTVGAQNVDDGREMYWLRVDRYLEGSAEDPRAVTQPMMCQHCEAAPCEYVCPVNATVHSDEGLNQQVYNRCIGTRFCSNNCPYKVRRFNFLSYHDGEPALVQLVHNPEVTVRSRGVMEKCSYCVQRIERARIVARREGRPLDADAVHTACEQACPTRAIVFGNLADPGSRVARLARDPRRYDVLHDLGTRPRTTYLARLRDPDPDL